MDLSEARRLRMIVSRTVAMEHEAWAARAKQLPEAERAMASEPARDGVPNLWKFGLGIGGPLERIRGDRVLPRPVRVERDGRFYHGLAFARMENTATSRIVYDLERFWEGGWQPVAEAVVVRRDDLGDGLQEVVLSDGEPTAAEAPAPQLRLVARYEPVPTFFVHYMSELSPGWSAMAYIVQPMPSYLRLFHEQPRRMQPVPKGPDDFFPSTGGVHRDLPLMPPGFSFSSAVESAELEVRRAQRAGVDGFAVNCLSGKTDFLEALFEAAARVQRQGSGPPPFQISLSLDINVLPHEDRMLLPTVADLILTWLRLGDRSGRQPHLARRGGRPMVMGYQSHWLWIDYLNRLMELWELEDGAGNGWYDPRLEWIPRLGARPPAPKLPEPVVADYRQKMAAELERLSGEGSQGELAEDIAYFSERGLSPEEAEQHARESIARRKARFDAVRVWAREADGWEYIWPAYQRLEEMVGQRLFWQFDAIDFDYLSGSLEEALPLVARHFDAINMFLPKPELTDQARRITLEAGAEWGEPMFTQYVAYGQNEQDGLFRGNHFGGPGTETLRERWYRAIGRNLETGEAVGKRPGEAPDSRSSLIQFTTWNDYNEHTHIAPSLQMRYALTELTRYFTTIWRMDAPPADMANEVFLFYRKYPEVARDRTFPFAHAATPPEAKFEVITILEEEGMLELVGQEEVGGRGPPFPRAEPRRVPAGFHVESFSGEAGADLWREGRVEARVRLASGQVVRATGWESITHRPFRQDTTLVGVSSRCNERWLQDVPTRRMQNFSHSEYSDADGDGLPNWFEMFYFGRGWINPAEQTGADPDGDENRDGRTNLEHYLTGTNPTYFGSPVPYRLDRQGNPQPLQVNGRRTTIRAEHFDRGGMGVAYSVSENRVMEADDRRRVPYELIALKEVYGHEADAGDWMLPPLGDGSWVTYTIEIPPGCYVMSLRVREGGGRVRVELDGEEKLSSEIFSEGLWTTQRVGRLEVERGPPVRTMRLRFENPGFGLNWIRLDRCR